LRVGTLRVSRGHWSLPRYGHAVAHHAECLGSAVAGIAAVIALSGCAGATNAQSEATTPPSASKPAMQPEELTDPTPTDREVINDLTGFIAPSGNVACMIDASWVRCDIIDRDWQPPPRPADCEFDYGQGITLNDGGLAEFVCAGDTAFGPDQVLQYGESITVGPMHCDSTQSDVTCGNTVTGHGFSISRDAYQLF
jgi:hypothetical protein